MKQFLTQFWPILAALIWAWICVIVYAWAEHDAKRQRQREQERADAREHITYIDRGTLE